MIKERRMQLGKNIKALRIKNDLTQMELAVKAGVTRISAIEAGRDNPTLKTIELIASALDVTVHDLICGENHV